MEAILSRPQCVEYHKEPGIINNSTDLAVQEYLALKPEVLIRISITTHHEYH